MFFISFLKLSIKVWKNLVRIQRRLLWGGVKEEFKISWVRWSGVCKPKKIGGFSVRDLWLTDLAILVKWRCRLLSMVSILWVDILTSRYGLSKVSSLSGGHLLRHISVYT